MSDLLKIAQQAKESALQLANLNSEKKNNALNLMADSLLEKKEDIFSANKKDLEEGEKLLSEGKLTKPLIKRLELNEEKLNVMIQSIKEVSELEDPVGETQQCLELDAGLELYKVSCPLGVVGAVFESRPDAVTQIASLCFKSGNACILKGGSEAKNTNKVLAELMQNAVLEASGINNAIQLIHTREDVAEMLKQDEFINLIIPRGSNKFVKFIQENTKIPVLGHSDGICHVYVDSNADLKKAVGVCYDSKTQYPAACNAAETFLVHKEVAVEFLPLLESEFDGKVEMRCDKTSKELLPNQKDAVEEDWETEYNDFIVSIKVVDSAESAINHINQYGSGHTDAVVTEDETTAKKFLNEIDAACVFWNCSTRFSDGFRFGKGAEIGISTGKIHARGPVGLEGMVIYKYLLKGEGQIVGEYSGTNAKSFTHKTLDKKWE